MKKIVLILSLFTLSAIGCTAPGFSNTLPPETPLSPEKPPEIIMVSVSPASIAPGQSAIITWSIANADSIFMMPGVGNISPSGTQEIKPAETTEYIITAKNKYGIIEEKIKLNVELPKPLAVNPEPVKPITSTNLTALPTIILFSADTEIVDAGTPVTFKWNVINATTIIIDNDMDSDKYVTSKGKDDIVLLPLINTVFRLRAQNSNGTSQATVIITMKPSIASGDDENRPSGPCG